MGLEWLVAACLGSSLVLLWLERRSSRRLAELAAQLERTAALQAEVRWWRESLKRLEEWQEVTESTIDGSTAAVREIHKGIASIPFEILDAIPATRDTSRVVRDIHDFTSDNVYAAISAVNKLAGEGGRRWLQSSRRNELSRSAKEIEPPPEDDPGHKPR